MKLYYSGAACSLAANIVLAEAGLAYDKEKVDLNTHKTETGADFYAINDKGYVPFLMLDNGEGLSEAAVILQYIADQKPQSGLAPKAGTIERYRLQEWMTYISSEIHKGIGSLFDKTMHEQTRATTIERVGKRLDWLSKKLDGKDYLMGPQFTIADAYLFTVLNWCQWLGIDLAKWPVLHAFHGRVGARPLVQEGLKAAGLIK